MEKIWLKHYQSGVAAEINPDAYDSLVDFFLQNCTKFDDKSALSNFGSQLTYREWKQFSESLAAYFQQILQLKKGDRIAIMLPNCLQYPILIFAALQAGLIIVNVNPLYTASELIYQINDADVETIVVLANFAHVVQKALPQTKLKHIIVTELGDLFPRFKSIVFNGVVKYIKRMVPAWNLPGAILFKKMLQDAKGLKLKPITLTRQDIAFLQYTGGTTGIAKGAILTHRNLLANIAQVLAWVKPALTEKKEIVMTPLPLYHIFSLTANCLTFIGLGGLNVLITNPRDISHLVAEFKKNQCTVLTGVNTLFNALLNNPDFVKIKFDQVKLFLGGGAAVQHAVAERWKKLTGKVLLEGYGLTETSPVVCIDPLNLTENNGSVGLPIASTDIAVLDAAGKELPLGEIGELGVKGPQVTQGYWQHPQETKKAFTEQGWFLTGDMVRIDEKGFVYIVDRKKDMILVSGFNVYPNEVEAVLAEHPGVFETAVISVPDEASGEAVKAFVVKKDPNLTEEALRAYSREHLTGYKRPKFYEFRESLPKTNVGKILRRQLREHP